MWECMTDREVRDYIPVSVDLADETIQSFVKMFLHFREINTSASYITHPG